MSHILRSSLKNSVGKLFFTYANRNEVVYRKALPCLQSYFLSKHFYSSQVATQSTQVLDNLLKKLDHDARRIGRISFKEIQNVLSVVEMSKHATATQSLMILRCCGNLLIDEHPESRTKLANKIWETLEKLGVNLDISHYNVLLSVYLENGHDFAPSDILFDLNSKGLEPNRVTFQRLITRYCQKGDIDGATSILECMREKDMPVNVTVFNALILGHSQEKDMGRAEGILSVMNQGGVNPNSESYAALICGYIRNGNLARAEELIKECETREFLFSDKDYFDIMYEYGKHGHEKEMSQIISRLRRGPTYNHEAVNLTFRLIADKKLSSAFKVLKSMVRNTKSNGTVLPIGNFFISHLVRCDTPTDEIVKYCKELIKENMNPQAFLIAMENSLRYGKETMALSLFKAAKENGFPLRTHYFWPLLVQRGKKGDLTGLFNLLSIMSRDYGVSPNTQTIREYVIPYTLKQKLDVERLLLDLKSCGCPVSAGVSSLVINLLQDKKIKTAAEVASSYKAYYPLFIIRPVLVNTFVETKDISSLVKLLNAVSSGIYWRANNLDTDKGDEEEFGIAEHRESTGLIVSDIVKTLLKNKAELGILEHLLQKMVEKEVGISANTAKRILDTLQDKLTPQISTLLEKLTSEEFSVPPTIQKGSRLSVMSLDENSLERLKERMIEKGESTLNIKKQLFMIYGRQHNLEKLLQIKQELEAENFVFTNGMYAHLIDAYVENKKCDEALQTFEELRAKTPEFSLNTVKLLRLALLLVENDRVDKAAEILKIKPAPIDKEIVEEGTFVNSSLCWRLLNVFAEKGDVDRVNEFFNIIQSEGLAEVNNILLGPLIKVHFKRNDLEAAMKTFEMCCQKFRATPWKNELARAFIEKEDAVNLQKLTDLSTQIHGEVNSLYDLMFTFMECGRIKQAKKIIETPGLQVRHDRLLNASHKYKNEGAIDHLTNLLEITKDIYSVNRSEIYKNLLMSYDKANDANGGLALWMQMQEENVQPTNSFLIALANLLKSHEMKVPFSVPEESELDKQTDDDPGKIRVSPYSQNLRKCLNQGQLDKALELKDRYKRENLNKWDWSLLIEGCLRQNRYKEAKDLFYDGFAKSEELPHERIFKYLIYTASRNGDIDFVKNCEQRLQKFLKKRVSYHNTLCRAYLQAGKAKEYLDEFEKQFAKIDETSELYSDNFPRSGFIELLIAYPDELPRVKNIIESCKKENNKAALDNILWSYYMLTNQYDQAEKIWDSLMEGPSNIGFGKILDIVRRDKDVTLCEKLIEFLKRKPDISPKGLGQAYGTLIVVLAQRDEFQKALNYLKEALTKISIDDFKIKHLVTLKTMCEAKNIEFPYKIPVQEERFSRKARRKIESGSDSDSD